MKNKIIALSVLLSILSGGCVNMQQSKDLLTIDVTKDYPQKEFALQDIPARHQSYVYDYGVYARYQ